MAESSIQADLLGEVVSLKEGLLFLGIERVGGRALKAHGRIIQLGQFSLARQQTFPGPKSAPNTSFSAERNAVFKSQILPRFYTYAISSFFDRRSSSRSMRSSLGKRHPINARVRTAIWPRSSRQEKSLEGIKSDVVVA